MQHKFINIKVRCPKCFYKIFPMQVHIVTMPDGKDFPFPINGCDELDGSEVCEKCRADVTLKFFHGIIEDSNEILTPDV